jgi:hypothetical protein
MNTNHQWDPPSPAAAGLRRDRLRMNANVGGLERGLMSVSDTVSLDPVKSTPLNQQSLSVFFPRP